MATRKTQDPIEVATKKLQAAEARLAKQGIDARNPAGDDAPKVHHERDAAILELVKLDAAYSFIAQTRGVPYSTNRGLIRVLQGGKRI
jgi:hypothetical protein